MPTAIRHPISNATTTLGRFGLALALSTLLVMASFAHAGFGVGDGCVASFGPQNGSEADSCWYVAGGPGLYASVVSAGRFEIDVNGEVVAWGSDNANAAGIFSAKPGDIVTVIVQCNRGVDCAAEGAAGVATARGTEGDFKFNLLR